MFKAIRIGILLMILFLVAVSTWLTQARSTDWNNTLWVKVYPINADGSEASQRYIAGLKESDFSAIEEFLAREIRRFGHELDRPLRMELGNEVKAQPPVLQPNASMLQIMLWSLRLR